MKNRQDRSQQILELGFQAPVGTPAGIEVLELATLRRRDVTALSRFRAHFHQLIALESGRLEFMVDFVDFAAEPGDWVWVKPGQVQRLSNLAGAEGAVILFAEDFLDPETAAATRLNEPGETALYRPEPPRHWTRPGTCWSANSAPSANCRSKCTWRRSGICSPS